MKVVNIEAITGLTVDSTHFTVDNTNITVDATTTNDVSDFVITLTPRVNPNDGDILELTLRRELTDDIYTIEPIWYFQNGYFTISFPGNSIEVVNRSEFEMTLKNNGVTIYLGNLLVLNDGSNAEDIQNYKTTEIVNKKLKF